MKKRIDKGEKQFVFNSHVCKAWFDLKSDQPAGWVKIQAVALTPKMLGSMVKTRR